MSPLAPAARTLNVDFDNWKWRKATIYDASDITKTPLYRVEFHMRKPQIRFQSLSPSSSALSSSASASAPPPPYTTDEKEMNVESGYEDEKAPPSSSSSFNGDATFPCLSSKINITLHNTTTTMSPRKFFSDAYTYASPARNNTTMTWESASRWSTFKIVCLDSESKMPVARMDMGCGSRTKGGTIELVGKGVAVGGDDGSMWEQEEVVLSGLAVMQQRLTNYVAAVSG